MRGRRSCHASGSHRPPAAGAHVRTGGPDMMHTAGSRAVFGTFAPLRGHRSRSAARVALAWVALVLLPGVAPAAAPKLALLLPDTSAASLQRPEIAAWIDAVREQGYE